jgi:hypothetical protein
MDKTIPFFRKLVKELADNNKVIENLIEGILLAVDKKINKAKFDRTIKGRIVSIVSENEYIVLINGVEYKAKSKTIHIINEIVYVLVPQNNFNDLFIIA